MTQLYFHDTLDIAGTRWLLEIYISPAPDTADEPTPTDAAEPATDGREWHHEAEPEPALPAPAGDLPIEIRPHPGRSVTRADVAAADSESARWALLAQRYPWLFADDPALDKPPATAKDIKRLGRSAGASGGGDTAASLTADLAAVADIADELLDDDGAPVYGAQSRVADALGVTNGGAHRKRILAVLAEIGSSTTTTAENAGQNAETGAQGREVA